LRKIRNFGENSKFWRKFDIWRKILGKVRDFG